MVSVDVQQRISLGDAPNPCVDPSHDLCFSCCAHDGCVIRVIAARPGPVDPEEIFVQCENCGAVGVVTGEDIAQYAVPGGVEVGRQ